MAVDAGSGIARGSATAWPGARDAVSEAVRTMAGVPGATYAAVVDRRAGALLAESGATGSGAALTALLTWARRAAALPGAGDVDDLVVTTDHAFHVLCRTAVSGVPVWAYLRVDRQRGNLARARRAARTTPSRPQPQRPAGVRPGSTRAGLPRRPPAALPAPPTGADPRARVTPPAVPVPALPVPAALLAPTSGWSDDTATLHRLLAGLRRLA